MNGGVKIAAMVRKLIPLALVLCALSALAVETHTLKIRAILVDGSLNQKPVPRLTVAIVPLDVTTDPIRVKTDFAGLAEVQLPAGNYRVESESPVMFEGKNYSWRETIAISGATTLDLSNDNAKLSDASVPQSGGRV